MPEAANFAPDVGTIFLYQGGQYRVDGWLKPKAPPKRIWPRDRFVSNQAHYTFCSREEAVYVSGCGVCGVIAPINEIEIIGRVDWSENHIDEHRKQAVASIGIEV